jgi:hypothetical protein
LILAILHERMDLIARLKERLDWGKSGKGCALATDGGKGLPPYGRPPVDPGSPLRSARDDGTRRVAVIPETA